MYVGVIDMADTTLAVLGWVLRFIISEFDIYYKHIFQGNLDFKPKYYVGCVHLIFVWS